MEGDPDGARALLLPAVRGDRPAAGAVSCHAARLRRPEPSGDDPVREVRPAPAVEPAERALCLRGGRAEPVDARRPGGRLRRGVAAAARADRGPRAFGRAAARRRHDGSHPRQGPDQDGPGLGVCPRRPPVQRDRSAGRLVLRLARPDGRTSRTTFGGLGRHPASRRVRRLQSPLSCRPQARPDRRGAVLEPCAGQVLRAGRHRRQPSAGKQAAPISSIALEAVKRIDATFDVEREINGLSIEKRLAARQERSASLVADLEAWMRAERAKLSRHAAVAKAMDYMLTRWEAFTRFLDDGRICLTNNAAERALRGLALERKSWLFAGSERAAERAALMYTLIHTAKLNDVDPQAWLADVLARIADHPVHRLDELLPWNWAVERQRRNLAA